MKNKVKVTIEVEASFWPYNTKRKNERAARHICRWLKETVQNGASFIPIYVEKDGTSPIEDAAEAKIKSIKCEVNNE